MQSYICFKACRDLLGKYSNTDFTRVSNLSRVGTGSACCVSSPGGLLIRRMELIIFFRLLLKILLGMLNLPKQKQQKIHNLLKKHSHRNLLILRTESQLSKCTNSAMFWHLSETELCLHLRIAEPSRKWHICSESLCHMGVSKSNALSTAEFDPL